MKSGISILALSLLVAYTHCTDYTIDFTNSENVKFKNQELVLKVHDTLTIIMYENRMRSQ